jgi:uncharacterized membrane protein
MNQQNQINNYNSLNKPVRILGLKGYYFVAFFLMTIILAIANIFLMIGFLIAAVMIVKKVQEEQRKGVPDYIKSFLVKSSSPKEILADNVFENLEK